MRQAGSSQCDGIVVVVVPEHGVAVPVGRNDLHRHVVAYNFIKYATKFFSRSYLVKNDAPLSVLRGFRKKEWQGIFERAGISDYAIQWKWAFRYLITVPGH